MLLSGDDEPGWHLGRIFRWRQIGNHTLHSTL